MYQLTASELQQHPARVAQTLVNHFVSDADAAFERMLAGGDHEALHDFRVAVRRVRATLKAYQRHLPADAKRARTDLRNVTRATGTARDAEVQLEWLDRLSPPSESRAPAVTRLHTELDRARQNGYSAARETIEEHYRTIATELVTLLDATSFSEAGLTTTAAVGGLVREQANTVFAKTAAIRTMDQNELLHRTRIHAKRLRYLLEPLGSELNFSRPVVNDLKLVQDQLGDLRDLSILLHSSDFLPQSLSQRVEAKRERIWDEFEVHWLSRQDDHVGRVTKVAERLELIIPELL